MKAQPLADWDGWLADLETERFGHGESREELLSRLELERPESPRSQFVRSWSEVQAAKFWRSREAGELLAPASLPPQSRKPRKPKRVVEFSFTDRQLAIAMQAVTKGSK